MNRVVLVGRITKDPELKKTSNNNSVVNFTIAINRTYTSASGERETDFINCVAWNKTAENMAAYVSKGALIGVEGRIQTRTYDDNDGKRVYLTEVYVDNLQFLESRSSSNQPSTNQNFQQKSEDNFFSDFNESSKKTSDILSNLDISDDELPF